MSNSSNTPRAYRRIFVTGNWLPDNTAVGAYWNGTMWNGFPVPMFTREDGDGLCAVMPNLVYVERRQAFLFDEDQQVEWYRPSIAVVDGKEQHLYAIGDSWCWQFADYADDPNVPKWLTGSYLQLHLRPSVRAWIQELARANGQSVEHHAEFLLACFCEERRDGRPKFDLSGFEATASRAQHATPISVGDAVRVRRGPWLKIVDAVLSLVAAEDGGEPSRLSREMFAETVLDGLARELGGVA
ncbi:hypothetical protein BJN34_36780 (plasmid) [Cupriavidus necator]|uniref:Uncharacterized protein n=1 Tax=Cupriavidus necator TaxID=106590 RepID=A0A1U9V3A9_CUPNE|nr:hypothetical protein [Cupriavidus necator]AQV99432.1 hypothetical protein BJN34_36780 [Cupriavidus necator]